MERPDPRNSTHQYTQPENYLNFVFAGVGAVAAIETKTAVLAARSRAATIAAEGTALRNIGSNSAFRSAFHQNISARANSSSASSRAFQPDTLKPGTSLQLGIKPKIQLNKANFTADEIAWIEHKYKMAEIKALAGEEISQVGAGVKYSYHKSQKFVRDTMMPGSPIKDVKIGDVLPGKNIDEFVSRQLGGRQVIQNQNIAPAAPNQLLGSLEYNAIKYLPPGTKINSFHVEWVGN